MKVAAIGRAVHADLLERADLVVECAGQAALAALGPTVRYHFEINNRPGEPTPTTSAVVPFAVLRAIGSLAGGRLVLR